MSNHTSKAEKSNNVESVSHKDIDGEVNTKGKEDDDTIAASEPLFKYHRYASSDLSETQRNKRVTCIACHNNIIVLGSSNGVIHVFDILDGHEVVELPLHSTSIVCICIDTSSQYIGSADKNGVLMIVNISNAESIRASYKIPITYMTFTWPEPFINSQTYMIGHDGQLVQNTRGWYGVHDTVIHSGEGEVRCIAMRNELVAWCNDTGVKVYDTANNLRVTYISKPTINDADSWGYNPHIYWVNDATFIIGWYKTVKVATIKNRKQTLHSSGGARAGRSHQPPAIGTMPSAITATNRYTKYVQVTTIFEVDFVICGVSALSDEEHLVLLGYSPAGYVNGYAVGYADGVNDNIATVTRTSHDGEDSGDEQSLAADSTATSASSSSSSSVAPNASHRHLAELSVVSYKGEEIYREAIPIHVEGKHHHRRGHSSLEGSSALHPIDLTLHTISNENAIDDFNATGRQYIISTPHDMIVASVRNADEHVDWLLSNRAFDAAVDFSKLYASSIRNPQLMRHLGNRYMTYLFATEQYEKAGELSATLLNNNEEDWLEWISKFRNRGELDKITPYIPTHVDCQLPTEVYESILYYFMIANPPHMLQLLRKWSSNVYDIKTVIAAVNDQVNHMKSRGDTPNDTWLDILAELYLVNREWHECINMMLRTGRRHDLFRVVVDADLFHLVKDRLLELAEFDSKPAIDMFVEHVDRIPVDTVMDQLSSDKQFTYNYLAALFKRDTLAAEKYHNRQLELAAELAPHELLNFLQKSYTYDTTRALEICNEKHLYREKVYILQRTNRHAEALNIIINTLGDVNAAIELVDNQEDSKLWDILIASSLTKPVFLSELLDRVTSHASISTDSAIDLQKLIKSIPDDLQIPNLRHKLIQIFIDATRQLEIKKRDKEITEHDLIQLHKRQVRRQERCIIEADHDTQCALCNEAILADRQAIRVFGCRHMYHESCFLKHPSNANIKKRCILCTQQHQGQDKYDVLLFEPLSPQQSMPAFDNAATSQTEATAEVTFPDDATAMPSSMASPRNKHYYRTLVEQMKAAQSVIDTNELTLWSDAQYF